MLSFEKGQPIVKLSGGDDHGELLRIYDHELSGDSVDVDKLMKELSKPQLVLLSDALENNEPEHLTGKVRKIYNKIKNDGGLGQEYLDYNTITQIVPTEDPDQRDSLYVAGPSGSGKSTFISQFIEEYKERYPERDVVLFAGKSEDPVLDKWSPLRVKMDMNLVEEPMELEELRNSLVIFDDADQITDKYVQAAVWKLRDQILEIGRSLGISVCTVAHQITNYKASRICLNEADYVVFFPKAMGKRGIRYFLKNYAGLEKDQINRIMNLSGRAVVLKQKSPPCIIHQCGCYFI